MQIFRKGGNPPPSFDFEQPTHLSRSAVVCQPEGVCNGETDGRSEDGDNRFALTERVEPRMRVDGCLGGVRTCLPNHHLRCWVSYLADSIKLDVISRIAFTVGCSVMAGSRNGIGKKVAKRKQWSEIHVGVQYRVEAKTKAA